MKPVVESLDYQINGLSEMLDTAVDLKGQPLDSWGMFRAKVMHDLLLAIRNRYNSELQTGIAEDDLKTRMFNSMHNSVIGAVFAATTIIGREHGTVSCLCRLSIDRYEEQLVSLLESYIEHLNPIESINEITNYIDFKKNRNAYQKKGRHTNA